MADNDIVTKISLEGGDTVAEQLAKIGEKGAAAFKQISDAAKGTSEHLSGLSNSLDGLKSSATEVPGGGGGRGLLGFFFGTGSGAAAEREIERTTSAAHRLREGFHILRPALEEAGVGLGGFGALTAVARLGVGGLTAAVGGAALVGLANLDDKVRQTRRGLGDLFQNPRTGNALYKDLGDLAKLFGTSADTFAQPLTTLVRGARQTGDAYPQVDRYTLALTSLYAAMRAGGASNEDATKGLSDFAEGLAKAGKLTPELLQNLEALNQKGADALAQSLGRINADQLIEELKRGVTEGTRTVIDALANTASQNKKTFEQSAKDVRTYKDALSDLKNTAARGIEDVAGRGPDRLVQDTIDNVRDLLGHDFSDIARLKTAIQNARITAFIVLIISVASVRHQQPERPVQPVRRHRHPVYFHRRRPQPKGPGRVRKSPDLYLEPHQNLKSLQNFSLQLQQSRKEVRQEHIGLTRKAIKNLHHVQDQKDR
jgi:hypothetical protein